MAARKTKRKAGRKKGGRKKGGRKKARKSSGPGDMPMGM
jgi:hypothetical protein